MLNVKTLTVNNVEVPKTQEKTLPALEDDKNERTNFLKLFTKKHFPVESDVNIVYPRHLSDNHSVLDIIMFK